MSGCSLISCMSRLSYPENLPYLELDSIICFLIGDVTSESN